MKLSKLLETTNPISGKKTSLLDVNELVSMALGVAVMIGVFAAGQNIAGWVSRKAPMIDTAIEPVVKLPGSGGEVLI